MRMGRNACRLELGILIQESAAGVAVSKCCSNLIRATGRCCSLFTLRIVKGPGNETWSTVSSECERKEETGSGVLFFLAN